MTTTDTKESLPIRLKALDVELDGTLKRGGFPIHELKISNNFSATEKETKFFRGQKFARTPFSTLNGSVYSAAVSDYLIGVTSLSYAASVGLPRPKDVGTGKTFIVKDEVGSAGSTTITIRSAGEETIDGASSATITQNYGSKALYSDGANWFTI